MWRLVTVGELDVAVRDDRFPVRIEVFAKEDAAFRVRYSRLDLFRIPATHPLDVWGAPASPPADELIWVAWPRADDAAHHIDVDDAEAALEWAKADVLRRVAADNARG